LVGDMKLALFDIYNTLPINSGGDWIRYQVLSELSIANEITGYYTYQDDEPEGYIPDKIRFNEEYIGSYLSWSNVPKPIMAMRPIYMFQCPKQLRDMKFDAVLFSTLSFHIAHQVAKRSKAPLIMLMHNIEWKYFKEKGFFIQLPVCAYEMFALLQSDAVIAISPADYDFVKNIMPRKKVFYVPPMEKEAVFSPTGKAFNYDNGKFNLLFYGSLDRDMNVAALRFITNDLLSEIESRKLHEKVRINIFGSGTPPSFLKHEDRVVFHGKVDDPSKYIRGADAVIVPVRNGGGVKIRILESLSCGKPVITTPECTLGLPEEKKKSVFVGKDVHEFVDHIIAIMDGKYKPTIKCESTNKMKICSFANVVASVLNA
jgi:glycosyltransferase involved in cell wall biosynthesis